MRLTLLFVLTLSALLSSACQAVPPAPTAPTVPPAGDAMPAGGEISRAGRALPAGVKDMFIRGGLLGFVSNIAENRTELGTAWSVGHRVGEKKDWFVELGVAISRIEEKWEECRGGSVNDCEDKGLLSIYTLNTGREWYLDDAKDLRARMQAGLGFFHAASLSDNDKGPATTLGGALQYRLNESFWADLSAAYYGIYSDIDRDSNRWRNALGLAISLGADF